MYVVISVIGYDRPEVWIYDEHEEALASFKQLKKQHFGEVERGWVQLLEGTYHKMTVLDEI